MAFNHRFPDVNALDTFSLVTLMNDPKKAAELWGKYKVAREEYEAAKAVIAEENTKHSAREAELKKAEEARVQADRELAARKLAFEKQSESWTRQRSSMETGLTRQKEALDARETVLAGAALAADDREKSLKAEKDKFDSWAAVQTSGFARQAADLGAREAAVAKREAKAEELAKIFKEL